MRIYESSMRTVSRGSSSARGNSLGHSKMAPSAQRHGRGTDPVRLLFARGVRYSCSSSSTPGARSLGVRLLGEASVAFDAVTLGLGESSPEAAAAATTEVLLDCAS